MPGTGIAEFSVDPSNWLLKRVESLKKNTKLFWIPEIVLGAEGNLQSQFDIYPNPADSRIVISTDQSDYTYQFMDMRGRVLLRSEHAMGGQEMNLEGIAGGFYLLRISSDGQIFTQKIKVD
jgi:hypothetical protein